MKAFKILITAAGLFLLASFSPPDVLAGEDGENPERILAVESDRLSPEIYISGSTPASYEERPAIAYNRSHGEYLVVWHNNRPVTQDIYARRVAQNGELLSWFTVSTASNCLNPSVAYNFTNDEYLVVWSQYNGNDARWEIFGRIIPWNGPGTHTPFLIASWSSMDLQAPVAVWNSYRNEYMVVWQTSLVTTGQLLGIGRRQLSNTGAALSNADMITGLGTTNQGSPDIAYNLAADGYLAVWVEPGTSAINVYGGRLSRAGALQGSKFAIEAIGNEQQKPAVSTNEQDRYMVIWQEMVGSDWDIHGKEVNSATGNLLPTQYLIAIKMSIDETAADLTCMGPDQECLFAWQESSASGEAIKAVRWGTDVPIYNFEVAPGGFGDNQNLAVAAGKPGFLIAYEWKSWTPGSDSDIFGHLWWPEGIHLPLLLRQAP